MLLNKNRAYKNVNITKMRVERGEKKCLKFILKYQQVPSKMAKKGKSKWFKWRLIDSIGPSFPMISAAAFALAFSDSVEDELVSVSPPPELLANELAAACLVEPPRVDSL
jgi:hypothetical protein